MIDTWKHSFIHSEAVKNFNFKKKFSSNSETKKHLNFFFWSEKLSWKLSVVPSMSKQTFFLFFFRPIFFTIILSNSKKIDSNMKNSNNIIDRNLPEKFVHVVICDFQKLIVISKRKNSKICSVFVRLSPPINPPNTVI